MKLNISEQVATISHSSATHNHTLLQKLRLDLPKVCGQLKQNINEERHESTKKPEKEAAEVAAKLSRWHYKCHMCNKFYPSIGQHLTRKHKSLNEKQKDMLRKNMLACKTLSAPRPTIKKTESDLFSANINATLATICKNLPKNVTEAITEFTSQMSFLVYQREVNYQQTLGLFIRYRSK